MDIFKFKEKLQRYLDGNANETENAIVDAWYRSYAADEQPLVDKEAALLHDELQANIKAATNTRKLRYKPLLRIAASVLLIIGAAALIWKYEASKKQDTVYYTVSTGTQRLKQVNLPDGSIVWLNAASRLQVPNTFQGNTRTVKLLEGEAFFEVKKDWEHPFIVHVGALNVQVFGTSFNIRNYEKLSSVIVSVATGKVGVIKNGHTLAMLLPGKQLRYDDVTGNYQQQTVSPGQAQSWKSGHTTLEDAGFKELSLVVKNMYGLNLKTSNYNIIAYHFSLRLTQQMSTNQLLKIISQLHHTRFRKEGNDIVLY